MPLRLSSSTAISGVGFVACFVVGAAVYGNGAGNAAPEITAYYTHESDRLRQILGFAFVLTAVLFFVVFVAGLRRALPAGVAADTILASGTGMAVLLAGANALWAATAFTVEFEPNYHIEPRTHLLLEDAGFVLFVSAAAFGIAFVAAAVLAHPFSRWFAWASVPVLGALAAAYWYIPFFAFLAWVLVAGLLL